MVIVWGVLSALPIVARTWTPDEVPIPYLQDARRYVSNPESILSPAAVDSIDRILFALERDKGVQTVVMVLDKLEGDDPYEFAMAVARKYGVGSKEKRTGLVVVLATGDRSYQFLTGNGLEATLPDATIQRIEDRIFIPELKQQHWDAAMVKAIAAIDKICRGDDSLVKAETKGDDNAGGYFLLIILVGGILFLTMWYSAAKVQKAPKDCPRCGKKEYRRVATRHKTDYQNGRRMRIVETTFRCNACGYSATEHDRYNDAPPSASGMAAGSLLGAMLSDRHRGGGRGWGGGSRGGSFGGGSFGGGGSGGRF